MVVPPRKWIKPESLFKRQGQGIWFCFKDRSLVATLLAVGLRGDESVAMHPWCHIGLGREICLAESLKVTMTHRNRWLDWGMIIYIFAYYQLACLPTRLQSVSVSARWMLCILQLCCNLTSNHNAEAAAFTALPAADKRGEDSGSGWRKAIWGQGSLKAMIIGHLNSIQLVIKLTSRKVLW